MTSGRKFVRIMGSKKPCTKGKKGRQSKRLCGDSNGVQKRGERHGPVWVVQSEEGERLRAKREKHGDRLVRTKGVGMLKKTREGLLDKKCSKVLGRPILCTWQRTNPKRGLEGQQKPGVRPPCNQKDGEGRDGRGGREKHG